MPGVGSRSGETTGSALSSRGHHVVATPHHVTSGHLPAGVGGDEIGVLGDVTLVGHPRHSHDELADLVGVHEQPRARVHGLTAP